ncbi:hypothetical protein EAG_12421 [Camponotus floridanus]|uniref:Uncharacterized protein n=1 Tax=Camponotus floridanus TaxID=104421 RepID=E2AWF8_CAMFO|nr:hypothetical protein EAG_12421 [Camponotus floridanus]
MDCDNNTSINLYVQGTTNKENTRKKENEYETLTDANEQKPLIWIHFHHPNVNGRALVLRDRYEPLPATAAAAWNCTFAIAINRTDRIFLAIGQAKLLFTTNIHNHEHNKPNTVSFECRLLGTLLGGTSNKGTVPFTAPPPGPPSPSSAGSRSSGTWRLLILDTQLRSKLRVTRTLSTSQSYTLKESKTTEIVK